MSENNFQGVDLTTGKLSLPMPLASVNGPNNFGESLSLIYSTLGLMNDVRTWNQDSPTGIAGLGWSLVVPFIARMGSGSIRDTFLLNGLPLLIKSLITNIDGSYTLQFETSTHTLNKITYETATETWTLIDENGVTYIYGSNDSAIDWGINWQSQGSASTTHYNQTPANWMDSSISTNNQTQFAIRWHVISKQNLYGQTVNYRYSKLEQNVGSLGVGEAYTMASYLTAIEVEQGDTLTLYYQAKENWEYPQPRVQYDSNSGTATNPYQDQISQHVLAKVTLNNAEGTLLSVIILSYNFLWANFGQTMRNSNSYELMNKRVLTSIATTNADGMLLAPTTNFDYWGYSDPQGDGFYNYYTSSSFNTLQMVNTDLSPSSFPSSFSNSPYIVDGVTYYPLFGHIKNITMPSGAVHWYSYREVSDNFDDVWSSTSMGSFSSSWQNRLDLQNIANQYVVDAKNNITWECFRIYWGMDNFAVLTFYSKSSSEYEGSYAMRMMIFEWVGQWIEVSQVIDTKSGENDNMEFTIHSWEPALSEDYNVISTGNGMFAFVRTNVSLTTGAIVLFNRDPYHPGYWQVSYFAPHVSLGLSGGQSINVSIAGSIITVNDRSQGLSNLFGFNGHSWDVYTITSTSNAIANAIATVGNNVIFFCPTNDASTLMYTFYRYDVTQSNPWVMVQDGISLPFQVYSRSFFSGISVSQTNVSVANGYVQVTANYSQTSSTSGTLYYCVPFIMSWDDTGAIYFQQIFTSQSWAILKGTSSSTGSYSINPNFSSVNSNLYYTQKNSKVAFRFTAGTASDTNNNLGWVTQSFPNDMNNQTTLANMPLIDMTINAAESGTTISYELYQYNPVTQTWEDTGLGPVFGTTTDWVLILAIINAAINLLSLLTLGTGSLISASLEAGMVNTSIALRVASTLMDVAIVPITTLLTGIIRAVGWAYSLSEATIELASFITGSLAGIADGVVQSIWQNYLMTRMTRKFNQGYSTPGYNYVFVGEQYQNPQLYYRQWLPGDSQNHSPGTYKWSSIQTFTSDNLANPVCSNYTQLETGGTGLTQSLVLFGNNFIAFDFVLETNTGLYVYYQCNGQVAFMQNGGMTNLINMPLAENTSGQYAVPAQYTYSESDYTGLNFPSGTTAASIPYQLFSRDDSSDAEDYGIPVMYAPWGGILGFLGQHTGARLNFKHYQYGLMTPVQLGLFMAKDQQVSGQVFDWIVDKVTVQDGYQTVATHFQYMPQQAVFDRSIQTIVYNQTRVASGGQTYQEAAQTNGWQESYFYNGGIYFYGSAYGRLNYDPLEPGDSPFNQANTNSSVTMEPYPLLLKGLRYCSRALKSQDGQEYVTGYETIRQLDFYRGFERPLYDSNGNTIGEAFSTGVLKYLSARYVAATNTTQVYIDYGYPNNPNNPNYVPPPSTTLSANYFFYDLEGFYGPWRPYQTNSTYFLQVNSSMVHLETALALATLTFNYRYDPNATNSTAIEGFYTVTQPGLLANVQNAPDVYQSFVDNNLYSANIESMVWYNPNISPAVVNNVQQCFATPSTAWGNENWQIIRASANPWQMLDVSSSQQIWYPGATFNWQGNADGSVWVQPNQYFPWASVPTNDQNTVWLQQSSSPTQVNAKGILLATQSNTGVSTFVTYDNQTTLPIASFENAGASENISLAFYQGFECYENFQNWSLFINQNPNTYWSFSGLSYTGNRSLVFAPTNAYTLTLNNITASNDARNWRLCFISLSQAQDPFTATLYANYVDTNNVGTQLCQINVSSSSTAWVNNISTFQFSSELSTIKNLTLVFDLTTTSNTVYLDAIYCFPAQIANFSAQTYDAAYRLLMAKAASSSFADYNFSLCQLYNNRQQLIGTVRRGDQQISSVMPNLAAAITLFAKYFSRNGFTNNNILASDDPNALIQITGGINQANAGYYFSFRDGVNPWANGGQVVNNGRLLLLNSGETATYSLPNPGQWGIAVRAQLQGWVVTATQTLGENNVAVALPTPGGSDPFHVWGTYTNGNSDYLAFDIYFDTGQNALDIYSSTSVARNNVPVLTPQNQLLVSDECDALFAVFQENNSNGNDYCLLRFVNNGQLQIDMVGQNASNEVYPVITTLYGTLYYADQQSGLFSVDITNVANQANLAFTSIPVFTYAAQMSPTSNCVVPPIVDAANTVMAFILQDTASNLSLLVTFSLLTKQITKMGFPDKNLIFTTTPAIAEDGSVAVYAHNKLYVFYPEEGTAKSVKIKNVVGNPVAGNNKIALTLNTGEMALYDTGLNLIALSALPISATTFNAPVIHGDKISVLAQVDSSTWVISTFNCAGLLACAPYSITANNSVSIQAFTPTQSSLLVMIDGNTFNRLDFSTPEASITLGSDDSNVTISLENDTFSLSGSALASTPASVSVPLLESYGDWLLMTIGNTAYFYADGQLIFAESLTISAPINNEVSLSAGSSMSVSWRDIVLLTDPTLSITYSDGLKNQRQTQQLAQVVTPTASS